MTHFISPDSRPSPPQRLFRLVSQWLPDNKETTETAYGEVTNEEWCLKESQRIPEGAIRRRGRGKDKQICLVQLLR
jgi:hypothetical protein